MAATCANESRNNNNTVIEAITTAQQTNGISFSLEVFPPKTQAGLAKLKSTARSLAELGPAFIDVTYGAGGGTKATTLAVCDYIQKELHCLSVMHVTCANTPKTELYETLHGCVACGVNNVLAVRGDMPAGVQSTGEVKHATDFVKFIHERFPGQFTVGVAGHTGEYRILALC